MKDITVYKLRFKAPLHIGTQGIGYETTDEIIHSDTIFSALMILWHNFYNDSIEEICQNPPFVVSSAFPFKCETYFFPKPKSRIAKESEGDFIRGKKLKKVKYVSKNILENFLLGNELEFDGSDTLQNGKFWVAKNELPRDEILFRDREVPRVTIDRVSNSSDIFYFSEIIFAEDSGLFFLVKFLKDGWQRKFEAVLRLLGDEGIGGDKHVAKGLFIVEKRTDLIILAPQNPDGVMNLSLYHPAKREIEAGLLNDADYVLITRKGWIHSPGAMSLRRQSVRMLQEGSVLGCPNRQVYGDCPIVLEKNMDIGLSHNVYRYGIGFCLPLRKGEMKR